MAKDSTTVVKEGGAVEEKDMSEGDVSLELGFMLTVKEGSSVKKAAEDALLRYCMSAFWIQSLRRRKAREGRQ